MINRGFSWNKWLIFCMPCLCMYFVFSLIGAAYISDYMNINDVNLPLCLLISEASYLILLICAIFENRKRLEELR